MSRYVVDASVVVLRLIREDQSDYARALFSRLVAGDEFVIPEFCILECTNVLWKRVRFEGLALNQAEDLIGDLIALPFQVWAVRDLMKQALRIGSAHKLAVYDSMYIALAQTLDCPLITIDQRQASVAAAEQVILKPLQDFASTE